MTLENEWERKAAWVTGAFIPLVTTTGGNDVVHNIGTRTYKVVKILAYNATGGLVTLQFGTMNNAAVPAFVQYFPTLAVVNNMDNEWTEEEIPAIEFMVSTVAAPNGRSGNLICLASAAGVLIAVEVAERGA